MTTRYDVSHSQSQSLTNQIGYIRFSTTRMCRALVVQHTEMREHTRECCTLTECVALLPYVSLTRFGECAVVRILYYFDHMFTSRVTPEKKLFFFIRLKSKQNLSAISGEFFPKIVNIWV